MSQPAKNRKSPLICLCNRVSQETIEQAIVNGCQSLGQIFDKTSAGVGPCGGSCQPTLKKMLESYLETGKFPEDPRPRSSRRSRR